MFDEGAFTRAMSYQSECVINSLLSLTEVFCLISSQSLTDLPNAKKFASGEERDTCCLHP